MFITQKYTCQSGAWRLNEVIAIFYDWNKRLCALNFRLRCFRIWILYNPKKT